MWLVVSGCPFLFPSFHNSRRVDGRHSGERKYPLAECSILETRADAVSVASDQHYLNCSCGPVNRYVANRFTSAPIRCVPRLLLLSFLLTFRGIISVLYQDEKTVCRSNKLSSALRTSLFRDGSFHCVLMVSSLGSYWKKANHQVSGLMFRMGGTILSMLFYHLGPYETFMRFEPVSVIC